MDKPIKAYVVKDRYDDYEGADVVFAENANQARANAHRVGEYVEYINRQARRAPEFDQYVGTGGPTNQQLFEKHGWWMTCKECEGMTTDSEGKWVGDGVLCDTCAAQQTGGQT